MARLLPTRVVLGAVNLFLLLLLAVFFLPLALAKLLGSAAALALVVTALKGRSSSGNNPASSRSLRLILGAGLALMAVLQAGLLFLGFANPFRLHALPGSTVFVDGNFFTRTANLAERERKKDLPSPENIRPWVTPRESCHYLRWDTHEIRVTKKWYVAADRSEESAQIVSVALGKLWNPAEAFAGWRMTSELKALFKIDYSTAAPASPPAPNEPGAAPAGSAFNPSDFRNIIEQWDEIWINALDQKDVIGHTRTDPYLAAVQIVVDRSTPHLDFQIRDCAGRLLKALRPIRPIREQTPRSNGQMPNPLTSLRDDIFGQLFAELGIPETISLAPATAEVADLALKVNSEVDTLLEAAQPDPANLTRTLGELEKLATKAAKEGQIDVAVAAQLLITRALFQVATAPSPEKRTSLVSELQRVRSVVEKAIQEQSGQGRIYLHLANESQRSAAGKMADKLKGAGFTIAGTYNVGGRAKIPEATEVRFFTYPEPAATKQSADKIVELLKQGDVSAPRAAYVIPSERDRERSSDIATHFEIWFAADSLQTTK